MCCWVDCRVCLCWGLRCDGSMQVTIVLLIGLVRLWVAWSPLWDRALLMLPSFPCWLQDSELVCLNLSLELQRDNLSFPLNVTSIFGPGCWSLVLTWDLQALKHYWHWFLILSHAARSEKFFVFAWAIVSFHSIEGAGLCSGHPNPALCSAHRAV